MGPGSTSDVQRFVNFWQRSVTLYNHLGKVSLSSVTLYNHLGKSLSQVVVQGYGVPFLKQVQMVLRTLYNHLGKRLGSEAQCGQALPELQ